MPQAGVGILTTPRLRTSELEFFPSGQEGCLYEVSCLREEQCVVCVHFKVSSLLGEAGVGAQGLVLSDFGTYTQKMSKVSIIK